MERPGGICTPCLSDAHDPSFLVGIFSRFSESGDGGGVVRAKQQGRSAAGMGMEIAVVIATIVVAPFTERRPHQSGQNDWQIRPICSRSVGRTVFTRRKRRTTNDETRRAARALQFVQWSELSAGRQALEGAELAPGNKRTLDQLRRRPDVPREAIPLARGSPMFDLDERTFNRGLPEKEQVALLELTCDHLRPLLDSPRDLHALFLIAEAFWPDPTKHRPVDEEDPSPFWQDPRVESIRTYASRL